MVDLQTEKLIYLFQTLFIPSANQETASKLYSVHQTNGPSLIKATFSVLLYTFFSLHLSHECISGGFGLYSSCKSQPKERLPGNATVLVLQSVPCDVLSLSAGVALRLMKGLVHWSVSTGFISRSIFSHLVIGTHCTARWQVSKNAAKKERKSWTVLDTEIYSKTLNREHCKWMNHILEWAHK